MSQENELKSRVDHHPPVSLSVETLKTVVIRSPEPTRCRDLINGIGLAWLDQADDLGILLHRPCRAVYEDDYDRCALSRSSRVSTGRGVLIFFRFIIVIRCPCQVDLETHPAFGTYAFVGQ